MEAGETKSYSVELDFTNSDLARDWSVTVWGTKGPVYVYNNDGTPSQAWEGAPPTKPALPGFDYSKFDTYASNYTSTEGMNGSFLQTSGKADGAGDRKFVLIRNNVPSKYNIGLKFSFKFKKSDMDGAKNKKTFGGVSSFDEAVTC